MTTPPAWTEDRIQQLLYEPQVLLADAAWRELIAGCGGLDALYGLLRALILPQRQRAVLVAVLDEPLAEVDAYADALHVHRTTFYRQQRQMFRTVAALLNETTSRAGAGRDMPPTLRALHQLRPPISDFVGRGPELAALLDAARRGAGHEPRAVIGCVHGMGGAGKTELAFALAHRLREQYPDAQLVLELRGARETPMTPAEALQAAIRAFAPQEQLPQELDALQQRYRSLLDGKRVLVLLDDARDAAQVRPLVPPVGCLLIATSRQRWTLPGMVSVQLDPLGSDEGAAFLRRLCERLTEAEAAAIAAACDQLPLALRVSGSLLAINPALSAARYIQRLGDARKRLEQLRDPDDPQLNVSASLELSYAALEPPAQRLLCQLAVLAADFDTDLALATAALPGEADAEELLHALLRRNVILYDAGRDRWRLHDLVRSLALAKLAGDEEAAARGRYAQAAVAIARQANEQYRAGGDTLLDGLARFDRDRPHLEALWRWAFERAGTPAGDQALVDAALGTNPLGHLRYHYELERRRHVQAAAEAAGRLGLKFEQGDLLRLAGVVELKLGSPQAAIGYQTQALELFEELGDQPKIAHTLVSLAGTNGELGRQHLPRTIELYRRALTIYEGLQDSRERNQCLNDLGGTYLHAGRLEEALPYLVRGLEGCERINDTLGRARGMNNVAECYWKLGRLDESLALYVEALALVRELGAVNGESYILGNLAAIAAQQKEHEKAGDYYRSAIACAQRIPDAWQEANCKWGYGLLLLSRGDQAAGRTALGESLAFCQQAGLSNAARLQQIVLRLDGGEAVSGDMADFMAD